MEEDIIVENNYKENIKTLNALQCVLLMYEIPNTLLQIVTGFGTMGEIYEENDNDIIAVNIYDHALHASFQPLFLENNTISAYVCAISDNFFNNKDFNSIFIDLFINSFRDNVSFFRLIVLIKDGGVIRMDIALNNKDLNFIEESTRLCNCIEIELAKALNRKPVIGEETKVNNREIVYVYEQLDVPPKNLYYLMDRNNINATRLIAIED